MPIPQIDKLLEKGKYDYAMQLATALAVEGNIEAMVYQCRILDHQSMYQQEYSIAKNIFEISLNRKDISKNEIVLANIAKAFSSYRFGRLREASNIIEKTKEMIETEIDKDNIARYYFISGILKNDLGKRKEAMQDYQISEKIWRSINSRMDLAVLYNAMGILYYDQNDHKDALEYFYKSLKLLQQIGNEIFATKLLNNIGLIHIERGEYGKAIEFLKRGLNIKKKYNSPSADFLHLNLGRVYFENGSFDEAEKHFLKSLHLRKLIGNDINISHALYYLILTGIHQGKLDKAEQYLAELEVLHLQTENKVVIARYLAAKGYWLLNQPRLYVKMQSYPLFEKVISEYEDVDHNLTVFAIENLIDLTLIEATVTNEEWLLEEIYLLGQKLLKIGQKQMSYPIVINSLILLSKIELIRKNIDTAISELEQAVFIAEEQGLEKLKIRALESQKEIENEISVWADLINTNADVVERVKQSDIMDYMSKVMHVVKRGV